MDMNRLHYFCMIAQAGSLSRASEMLHISQSALSKAVKTLEEELEEKLMIPSGRGIAITDAGWMLVNESKPLLERLQKLKVKLKEKEKVRPSIRLGSFEVFTTYFLGRLLQNNKDDIHLETFEMVPGPLEQAVKKHRIDLGITYLPIPDPDLDFLKVATIQMGVFGKKDVFKNTKFADLPWVPPNVPISGTPAKVNGLDGWPDDLYPRKSIHRVEMLEGALEICRQGIGVSFFPKFIAGLHNQRVKKNLQLEEVPIPKHMKVNLNQDVYVVKRKVDPESAFIKKLAKEIRLLKNLEGDV